jgi:hypothetical protein
VLGYIGNPPETFEAVEGAFIPHVEGQERIIELHSNGTEVTTWVDGKQVNFTIGVDPIGLNPFMVPAPLLGSTLHGFCVDTHLVTEASVPTTPVMHSVSFNMAA